MCKSFSLVHCTQLELRNFGHPARIIVKTHLNPYLIDKRKELGLPVDQKALLTWDVFRGQTTDHVAQILDSLNIKVVKVPASMTHFTSRST